jgi:hypothetical protein
MSIGRVVVADGAPTVIEPTATPVAEYVTVRDALVARVVEVDVADAKYG